MRKKYGKRSSTRIIVVMLSDMLIAALALSFLDSSSRCFALYSFCNLIRSVFSYACLVASTARLVRSFSERTVSIWFKSKSNFSHSTDSMLVGGQRLLRAWRRNFYRSIRWISFVPPLSVLAILVWAFAPIMSSWCIALCKNKGSRFTGCGISDPLFFTILRFDQHMRFVCLSRGKMLYIARLHRMPYSTCDKVV